MTRVLLFTAVKHPSRHLFWLGSNPACGCLLRTHFAHVGLCKTTPEAPRNEPIMRISLGHKLSSPVCAQNSIKLITFTQPDHTGGRGEGGGESDSVVVPSQSRLSRRKIMELHQCTKFINPSSLLARYAVSSKSYEMKLAKWRPSSLLGHNSKGRTRGCTGGARASSFRWKREMGRGGGGGGERRKTQRETDRQTERVGKWMLHLILIPPPPHNVPPSPPPPTLLSHRQSRTILARSVYFELLCVPCPSPSFQIRLVGLVVKVSASRPEDQGSDARFHHADFSRIFHTSDFKIGTQVATLPGARRCRVSAGTGWPSVSILWQGGVESWIWNSYLSVAAHKHAWVDPSVRDTSMLLDVKQPTNNNPPSKMNCPSFLHVLFQF